MTYDSLADNPTYRAGVLMGRQQSITDVMGLLVDPDGGTDGEKAAAILKWCVQTQEETRLELKMIVADLEAGES